jgi:MFS family permease
VLALASLIVVGGTPGDRYGRKRLYLIGLATFAIFSAACGLARSDVELIKERPSGKLEGLLRAPEIRDTVAQSPTTSMPLTSRSPR